ncbi:putative cytosol aminopeptidase [Nitrosopumilaceae archaeon]|nr:leucyl aminopeptidase family protein [Nitrosopumilus sp.]CAI9830980.1 putative cytosol aminopeptidase [Nitrosopumilaceae archaeon]MDA7942068.1 leucyl aminopeptidase family protein [Nitrosopumilus sp.]MDA7943828.1 leucyl aminopeptidase family protein [Nitrosopumilus sp.]MDA7944994.1 leucyl aminopeptidase family protein [Nitrosopumilus sp.]
MIPKPGAGGPAVRIVQRPPAGTPLLCVFAEEGRPPRGRGGAALERAFGDTGGRLGETGIVYNPGGSPTRMMVAGLGDGGPGAARHAAGAAARRAAEIGVQEIAIVPPPGAAAEAVEGAMLALYRFDRFRAEKKKVPRRITVVARDSEAAGARGAALAAGGVRLARDIANTPPNECAPADLASAAKKLSGPRLRCTVLGPAELSRRGFGGMMAVGGGSRNGPRLIILEYMGGPRGARPAALVGKAVTFDTGGISLKPRERMEEMKFDKCGGCAVLGALSAAALMRVKANVVGIIPSVENMPGGGAYRPGDIVTLYGGRTAEIINTDAEGRLILADALAYAREKYSPEYMLDFATLTGACIVALGSDVAGLFSNDDRLAARVEAASARSGEDVWRLPVGDRYERLIRSEVADSRNMGIGTAAGAISAAEFLRMAAGSTPWAHVDIAGTAWMQQASRKRPYNPGGATGFGVRLALEMLRQ